jgi:hypothetical protein
MSTATEATGLALALPPALKPKPTKGEIVEALAQLQEAQMRAERQAAYELAQQLRTQSHAALLAFVKANLPSLTPSISLGYQQGDSGKPYGMEVNFKLNANDLAPDLVQRLRDWHLANTRASSRCHPKELRQQIRDRLTLRIPKTERVEAMLASPEMRQALEATLTKLNE